MLVGGRCSCALTLALALASTLFSPQATAFHAPVLRPPALTAARQGMPARPRCAPLALRAPWGALRAAPEAAELGVGGLGVGGLPAAAEPGVGESGVGGLPAGAALLLGFQEGEDAELREMIAEASGSRVVRCNDADLGLPVSALLAGDGGGEASPSPGGRAAWAGPRMVVFVNDGDADTEALMATMDEDPGV